jgi:hypothetical protein
VHYTAAIMRTDRRVLMLMSGLCWFATAASGVTNEGSAVDRNYRVIVERNPFGLKPPPPPPTNAPVAAPAKDEVLLTGITSIGSLRAYFMTKAPQAKQPEYFCLGVKDIGHGVEVVDIDPAGKSVRVRNSGVESVMTFAANGVKPPATPATGAPGPPGSPPAPGMAPLPGAGGVPAPGGVHGAATAGVGVGVPGTLPGTAGTVSSRMRTIPSRSLRTPTAALGAGIEMPSLTPPAVRDPNAPLQDALMMELQKQANRNPNITFPPTPLPP